MLLDRRRRTGGVGVALLQSERHERRDAHTRLPREGRRAPTQPLLEEAEGASAVHAVGAATLKGQAARHLRRHGGGERVA
eukprot:1981098-Prymnesium_polylepis.2